MTIQELLDSLTSMPLGDEVIVAMIHDDGIVEAFPIQAITNTDGQVWLEIPQGSLSP